MVIAISFTCAINSAYEWLPQGFFLAFSFALLFVSSALGEFGLSSSSETGASSETPSRVGGMLDPLLWLPVGEQEPEYSLAQ